MSFEPCQNCGRPVSRRGLCDSCAAAANDENEAVYLTEAICSKNGPGASRHPKAASLPPQSKVLPDGAARPDLP